MLSIVTTQSYVPRSILLLVGALRSKNSSRVLSRYRCAYHMLQNVPGTRTCLVQQCTFPLVLCVTLDYNLAHGCTMVSVTQSGTRSRAFLVIGKKCPPTERCKCAT